MARGQTSTPTFDQHPLTRERLRGDGKQGPLVPVVAAHREGMGEDAAWRVWISFGGCAPFELAPSVALLLAGDLVEVAAVCLGAHPAQGGA